MSESATRFDAAALSKLARQIDYVEPVPDLPAVAERQRLRRATGLSQAKAALVVGVAYRTFREWELGTMQPNPLGSNRYRRFLGWCTQEALAAAA